MKTYFKTNLYKIKGFHTKIFLNIKKIVQFFKFIQISKSSEKNLMYTEFIIFILHTPTGLKTTYSKNHGNILIFTAFVKN